MRTPNRSPEKRPKSPESLSDLSGAMIEMGLQEMKERESVKEKTSQALSGLLAEVKTSEFSVDAGKKPATKSVFRAGFALQSEREKPMSVESQDIVAASQAQGYAMDRFSPELYS